MYVIKCLILARGQSVNTEPFEIKRVSRYKEAQGECKAHRNSLFKIMLEKFEYYPYDFCYFEWKDYYAYTLETPEGIQHEAHVYLEEQ